MVHRVLKIGHWVVDFLFVRRYDEEAILAILYDIGASKSVIRRAEQIMRESELNRGFTFANPYNKRALVVIGPSSSGAEFVDSLVHELHHLSVAIGKSIGYDLDGEGPAYLSGDSARALVKTICELGCDRCNHKNIQ